MISREEFRNKVDKLIEDTCDKETKNSIINTSNSSGVIFIILGVIFFPIIFVSMPLLIIGIIIEGHASSKKNALLDKYKNDILKILLEDKEYEHDKNSKISREIFNISQFASRYDYFKGEDYFSLKIDEDVYFRLSDLHTYYETKDDDGNTDRHTTFKGTFGYVKFKESFKNILCLNSYYRKKGASLKKIELESIDFNKKFLTYCDDQVEARYILTPDIMEYLMSLKKKASGLRITLVDNYMFVSFSNNLFSLRKYKNRYSDIFMDYYDDLEIIINIIESIKKNDKIFKI